MTARGSATEKVLAFLREKGVGKTFSTTDIERATALNPKTYWTILKRLQDQGRIRPAALVREKAKIRAQRSWTIEASGDRKKERRTEAPVEPRSRRSVAEYVATLPPGEIISTRAIMDKTGVARASAHEAIQKLEKKGLIEKAGLTKPPTGRPLQTYRVKERAGAPTRTAREALAAFVGPGAEPVVRVEPPATAPAPPAPRPSRPPAPRPAPGKSPDLLDLIVEGVRKLLDEQVEVRAFEHHTSLKGKEKALLERAERLQEECAKLEGLRERDAKVIAELTRKVQDLEGRLQEQKQLGAILDQVAARVKANQAASAG